METKQEISVDQQKMLTHLARVKRAGTITPEEDSFLSFYRSLPRFDQRKTEMLSQFNADKSCKWVSSYTQD